MPKYCEVLRLFNRDIYCIFINMRKTTDNVEKVKICTDVPKHLQAIQINFYVCKWHDDVKVEWVDFRILRNVLK